jgi:(E)-4-hydroxy-3-methylbut-2-enyl-diphosphate synthase
MTAPPLAARATPLDWRRLWSFTLDPYRAVRRPTRTVRIGDVAVGGAQPIRVQSMTVADTLATDAVVDEICALVRAGCEIVRVTAPTRSAAENLREIRARLRRQGVRVPIVADIHFTPQAALIAALHADKVRINPGNYADRKHFAKWEYTDAEYAAELERLEEAFRPLVLRCKELGVAMRIGTNHGSLSDRILNRYGDTPLGMVESALEFVRICEHHGYRDLVLSMKASDVKVMVQAYRLLSARMRELGMDYPFHLGVTEAGAGFPARVKSAIGIGALLADGLGDTVRVSLAEDSVHELSIAAALAQRAALPGAAAGGESALPPPRIDPYRFARRACRAQGEAPHRLASDTPPRLEARRAAPARLASDPRAARAWLDAERNAVDGLDVLVVAPDASLGAAAWLPALAPWSAAATAALPAVAIEMPLEWIATNGVAPAVAGAARLVLCADAAALAAALPAPTGLPPVQYTLVPADRTAPAASAVAAALAARVAGGEWPHGAIALEPEANRAACDVHAVRAALAAVADSPLAAAPLVLRARVAADAPRIDADLATDQLDVAVALGAVLADGAGDAVQVGADSVAAALGIGAEILQSTRLRLSKADFIACPSCGRTQFDLQTTTARIAARLQHLRGLKIAVMGCIVNGPGEMADADFGYVGSGPGRIDLYVGQERVERGVPQAEAVDRLVALIRSRGLWVDPPEPARLDSTSSGGS